MFTGIIQQLGRILAVAKIPSGIHFTIEHQFLDLKLGESIAVDGICLTVVAFSSTAFECEVSPETLHLTNLYRLKIGDLVNLERSLSLNDRLGGHFVYGHIDKTYTLEQKVEEGDFWLYHFGKISGADRDFIVKKGSITINGVSLTINSIDHDIFSVMLIPHTLTHTNLGQLEIGQSVNIEFDILTRIIAHQISLRN